MSLKFKAMRVLEVEIGTVMRKIKEKQIGRWCDYCPTKTTKATWRSAHWLKVACDEHRNLLFDEGKQISRTDGTYAEADYQTWLRLD